MARSSALQVRLRIGFAVALFLTLFIGGVSLYALRSVIGAKDDVISQHTQRLLSVQQFRLATERDVSSSRAYLLTEDTQDLHRMLADRQEFRSIVKSLQHGHTADDDSAYLGRILGAHDRYVATADEAVIMKQQGRETASLGEVLERRVLPEWGALRALSDSYLALVEARLIDATQEAGNAARRMTRFVAVTGAGAFLLAAGVFVLGWRTLTSLSWAERELRSLNQDLEGRVRERTRELESYSYSVAHDLRAPLRAMTGFSQLLLEDCEGKNCASCRDFKRRIEESARRMDRLILDLLSYSRLSREDIQLEAVSLSTALEKAARPIEAGMADRQNWLRVRDPLPAVLAQEVLLVQVLENLISNAVKFVPPGVRPEVTIRTERWEGFVRVWVEDLGIGIPAEYHDRIFGIFERLNRTEEYPGTGIGLAIVRRAVQRMGGRTGFESEPGRGSRFWFELKAAA